VELALLGLVLSSFAFLGPFQHEDPNFRDYSTCPNCRYDDETKVRQRTAP